MVSHPETGSDSPIGSNRYRGRDNNSNEFQASMQEIKSRGMIMTAFMKEMKQRYQIIMENLRERGNQGRKLLISLKGNFLTNSGGSIMRTCKKLVNFHRSPM